MLIKPTFEDTVMLIDPPCTKGWARSNFFYTVSLMVIFFNGVNGFFNLRQYRSRLFVGLTALMVCQNGFTTHAITKFQNKIVKFHHIYKGWNWRRHLKTSKYIEKKEKEKRLAVFTFYIRFVFVFNRYIFSKTAN